MLGESPEVVGANFEGGVLAARGRGGGGFLYRLMLVGAFFPLGGRVSIISGWHVLCRFVRAQMRIYSPGDHRNVGCRLFNRGGCLRILLGFWVRCFVLMATFILSILCTALRFVFFCGKWLSRLGIA